MAKYKIIMVPVDDEDSIPPYVTQKRVYPVKHIGEDDGAGNVIFVTTVTTQYYDATGMHLPQFDRLDRFEGGEYRNDSPEDMMDLSE